MTTTHEAALLTTARVLHNIERPRYARENPRREITHSPDTKKEENHDSIEKEKKRAGRQQHVNKAFVTC